MPIIQELAGLLIVTSLIALVLRRFQVPLMVSYMLGGLLLSPALFIRFMTRNYYLFSQL